MPRVISAAAVLDGFPASDSSLALRHITSVKLTKIWHPAVILTDYFFDRSVTPLRLSLRLAAWPAFVDIGAGSKIVKQEKWWYRKAANVFPVFYFVYMGSGS